MRRFLLPLALLALSACGGSDGSNASANSGSDTPSSSGSAGSQSWDPSAITPSMVALGDSVFHGLKGATSCQACHGADGAQATVAPDLTDATWLHNDGSWEGIYKTVKEGVMAPIEFTSVMPPDGGVPMPDDQRRAVAAYVYRLSHP